MLLTPSPTPPTRCSLYQGLEYEPPAELAGDGEREGRWPSRGAIRLEDVSMRYRPDLPRVLHGLSLDVAAGQKVGIVGRTGAGQSPLKELAAGWVTAGVTEGRHRRQDRCRPVATGGVGGGIAHTSSI